MTYLAGYGPAARFDVVVVMKSSMQVTQHSGLIARMLRHHLGFRLPDMLAQRVDLAVACW